MGIGGGIITRKLLFAVLLISSLSLAGIAGASASDMGAAQTQDANNSSVQEKVNIETNSASILNKSAVTENSTDTSAATSNVSTNQSDVKTQSVAQDTVSTSTNQTTTNSTVTSTNLTSKNSVNTETNTQNAALTAANNSQNSTSTVTKAANSTVSTQEAAAGSTKTTVTTKNFTTSQINDAAARVKAYIETNHVLPKYVTIGTTQVQMPDFLKLLTANLLQINSKTNTSITLKNVGTPAKPIESIKDGNIVKSGYLDLAKRVNAFIDANGVLPNYANSNLGKLRYENLIYIYSKILNYYKVNKVLPNYVTVKAWSKIGTGSTTSNTSGSISTPVPADLQIYLQATKNAQSNDPTIKALAAKITSGKTSTYDKAAAVFNWVRDNLGYSFYYNTKYGAVGALKAKTGNCVDTSHLVIALARAAGLPSRYAHGDVKFPSGSTYGHVWAQIWVNGKWYTADGTSSKNTFGTMVGTVVNFKGYHRELSF